MTIAELARYLAAFLVVSGALFGALAGLGVLRLPDLYTRMHSASKAGAVGAGFILLAVALSSFDGAVALRAVLGIVFVLMTTPLSAHLLARAAYQVGVSPSANTGLNEIEEAALSKTPRD